jgi:glycosyltransferase involved in cell wall biosynthesis
VGRFAEGKNHRFAVETFSIVNRERPDMHLVLVGDGPLLDETRQKVASLGLTAKTHFLGVRQEIPQIMFALDALMLPSVYEGFGIVSIEAQAAGTPCLASTAIPAEADVGDGLLDRIELACGPEVWATRMLQIMSRERTPLNLAATAVRAAGYDLSETVAQLTRLYLE